MKAKALLAMTLMELLVALVLSVLVLGMALPLLAELTHPANRLDVPELPAWRRALQADLRELVSPQKCGVPVLQIIPASDTVPYPQLVLQTFCRAGDAKGGAASRGPSEVRYVLESDAGTLLLVRYARGWHDPADSRNVLAEHVTGWQIQFDGAADGQTQPATQPAGDSPALGGVMRVDLSVASGNLQALFWVPRLDRRLVPASQPVSKDLPDSGTGDGP